MGIGQVYHSRLLFRVYEARMKFKSNHRIRFIRSSTSVNVAAILVKIQAYHLRIQANPYALYHPPDPRNDSSHSGLCSLLQAFPTLHTHPNICYQSSHIAREDSYSRPLRL